jgi:argininosuccinate lyase
VADYLVRKGMAFRKAHAIVGRLVALSEKKKLPLARIPLEEYRRQSRAFDNDVYAVLTPRSSIARKKSAGSTSPGEVARSIQRWKNRLK